MLFKKHKVKLSIKRIFSNNLFILKEINKVSKSAILIRVLLYAFLGFSDFVSSTFLLWFVLNCIENQKSFSFIAGIILIWLIIKVVFDIVYTYYFEGIDAKKRNTIQYSLNNKLFTQAAKVDLNCYENPFYYEEMVKAINEQNILTSVLGYWTNSTYTFVRLLFTLYLLFKINPIIFIFVSISFLAIPLNLKSSKYQHLRTIETEKVNRHRDYPKRVFYLSEYAKELRLSNMAPLMIKRFRKATNNNLYLLKKYGIRIATVDILINFINQIISTIGATIYSVYSTIVTKTMGLSDCIAVINSIETISSTIINFANTFLVGFYKNALTIEKIRTFLELPTAIKNGEKAIPKTGDLVFKNVSFKYDGATEYTLKNINLRFGEKEKIAIVGHNGAGKSTLVKLLLRLYDCEGEITLDNTNIKDLSLKDYRECFSIVLQDHKIFALTVSENVLLRKNSEKDYNTVKQALIQSDIYDKIMTFKNKENTILTKEFDDDGELLSGGQEQKLSIAHIYSKNNRFVILDEPSSALDPIAEFEMYENMYKACKDCGMIFISHRLSSAVNADRIFYMEDGTVKESGTHKELMELNGSYASMFKRQANNYKGGELNGN